MSHGLHDTPHTVLDDKCDQCWHTGTTIQGLANLDHGNLRKLAELARLMKAIPVVATYDVMSRMDYRAVENLRLAARIVFASGITKEDAE